MAKSDKAAVITTILYWYFKLWLSVNLHREFQHPELRIADGLNTVFVLGVWFLLNLTVIASEQMLKSGIICSIVCRKKLKGPQRKLVLCSRSEIGGILVLLGHSQREHRRNKVQGE